MTKNLTIEEVIAMTPKLQEFAKRDAGFSQFGDRYAYALGDPEVRKEYAMWVNELMREQGRIDSAERRAKTKMANNLLLMGVLTPQQIAEAAELPLAAVLALRDSPNT
jgi:hypothetical protein